MITECGESGASRSDPERIATGKKRPRASGREQRAFVARLFDYALGGGVGGALARETYSVVAGRTN